MIARERVLPGRRRRPGSARAGRRRLVVRSGFDDDADGGRGRAARAAGDRGRARRTPTRSTWSRFRGAAPAADARARRPGRGRADRPTTARRRCWPGRWRRPRRCSVIVRDAAAASPRVRHLRLPLDGGEPLAQEIGARVSSTLDVIRRARHARRREDHRPHRRHADRAPAHVRARHARRRAVGQVRVPEPGRLGEGSRRLPDDPRRDPHRARSSPGKTIIDSTSGNTGVAYSLIGGALGFPVTLVMPGNVSWARRKITEAFGTKLVFSDPMEGSDGAIRLCRKIVEENPGSYFYPDQYSNLSNPLAHYNTHRARDLGADRGARHPLRDRHRHHRHGDGDGPAAQGVPARHRGLGGRAGGRAARPRGAQAHGELDRARPSITPSELDGVLPMDTDEAWDVSERLAKHEGLLVGHSSGASLAGGVRIAKRLVAAGKPGVIVDAVPRPRRALLRGAGGPKAPKPTDDAVSDRAEMPAAAPRRSPPRRWPRSTRTRGASYPNECCGIVFGPKAQRRADRAVACVNIQNELHAEDPVEAHARRPHRLQPGRRRSLQAGQEPARRRAGEDHLPLARRRRRLLQRHRSGRRADGRRADLPRRVRRHRRPARTACGGAAQFAWDAGARRYVEIGRYPAG